MTPPAFIIPSISISGICSEVGATVIAILSSPLGIGVVAGLALGWLAFSPSKKPEEVQVVEKYRVNCQMQREKLQTELEKLEGVIKKCALLEKKGNSNDIRKDPLWEKIVSETTLPSSREESVKRVSSFGRNASTHSNTQTTNKQESVQGLPQAFQEHFKNSRGLI